jgi:hypothetical protein
LDWLEDILDDEAAKVARLKARGVSQYVLVTNAVGTAQLDTGTLDTVDRLLAERLSLPAKTWWRDDLDRRLDNAWDIKWSHPNVMSGVDALRALIEAGLGFEQERRSDTIRAYLADQYGRDEEVRFRQIELQSPLLDLYVDLPLSPSDRRQSLAKRRAWASTATAMHDTVAVDSLSGENPDFEFFPFMQVTASAAAMLIHPDLQRRMPRIVLEGAPGQGKSTVTQYVAQLYRMSLLGNTAALDRVPSAHRPSSWRIPIRVELRDYASWVNGDDPFRPGNRTDSPDPSLEQFLAGHIRHFSSSPAFVVEDLRAVLRVSAAIVILDGLDEVPDVDARRHVVTLLEEGLRRLEATAASLQVVITSRPAAFANSPGMPASRYFYCSLDNLTKALVEDYSKRWLQVRGISGHEADSFLGVVQSRLASPPLADLSRNPMQLSILLSLVVTHGSSIPDKRSALFDAYMALAFNREAEKSVMVRTNRDLLGSVHGYLGWILQAEAEAGENGRITVPRLRAVLRAYLEQRQLDPNLLDDLFGGVVERVVALVSRLEGTLEFEVQPIREYFAAKHLFETAPMSPPGNEATDSRPVRFDGMAQNPYWLNVTRFYAGFHSRGELPYLVDRLEMLAADPARHASGHAEQLASMLLADLVFGQEPRSEERALAILKSGDSFRLLTAPTSSSPSGSGLASTTPPKRAFIEHLLARVGSVGSVALMGEVRDLTRTMATANDLCTIWLGARPSGAVERVHMWLALGAVLDAAANAPWDALESILSEAESPETYALLAACGCDQFLLADANRTRKAFEAVLDLPRLVNSARQASPFVAVARGLDARIAGKVVEFRSDGILMRFPNWRELSTEITGSLGLDDFSAAAKAFWAGDTPGAGTAIDAGIRLLDASDERFGSTWTSWLFAVSVARRCGDTELGRVIAGDSGDALAGAWGWNVAAQQHRKDPTWWLDNLSEDDSRHLVSVLTVATPRVLRTLLPRLCRGLEELSVDAFDAVCDGVDRVLGGWSPTSGLSRWPLDGHAGMRLLAALHLRMPRSTRARWYESVRDEIVDAKEHALSELESAQEFDRLLSANPQPEESLKRISRNYGLGVELSFDSPPDVSNAGWVSDSVCSAVADAPLAFPRFIVQAVVARQRVRMSQAVRHVAAVAAEQEWSESEVIG